MRNRLKGVTLIETMLYIGLFAIIMIIVLNFMLSTQEATLRTNRKSNIHQATEFVTQHINYSFEKAISINSTNSTFGNNQGVLELVFTEGSKQYSVLNSTLYFDGVPITPPTMSVDTFSLDPIYKGVETIIGIRTNIIIHLNDDTNISDTINLLSILR